MLVMLRGVVMGLLHEIKQDVLTHKAYFGVSAHRALRFPSLKILISFRLRRATRRWPLLNSFLQTIECLFWGIEISPHARLGSVIFLHTVGIVIGSGSVVGDGTVFNGGNVLGNRFRQRAKELSGCPKLGKNVEIGCGAKILGSITVGNNVQIGANAVVITNIPSNSVAIGIPAKHLNRKTPA